MAYRKTERVEARLADNRQRILDAARVLVSEGGWAEAQVSHVASAAGVATGSVYRYFPSKADLFVEVLSVVSQREVDVLEAIAENDDSPYQTLHAGVVSPNRRKFRQPNSSPATIASRSMTWPSP